MEDVKNGINHDDPLLVRPRIGSAVLCGIIGVILLAITIPMYRIAVWTLAGQEFEDSVWLTFSDDVPNWMRPILSVVGSSSGIILLCAAILTASVMLIAFRQRWQLLLQCVLFGAACLATDLLKPLLPRPIIVHTASISANSAPSGHTLLVATSATVLLMAVPRAWRAIVAVIDAVLVSLVGLALIHAQWHRPVDILMSVLIVGGLMMIAMSITRGSGMDQPGMRASSPSIQIVATTMITLGMSGLVYSGYLTWQLYPGLASAEKWTIHSGNGLAAVSVVSTTCVVFGLLLAFRQLTASPLSRLGLIGAAPPPPVKQV